MPIVIILLGFLLILFSPASAATYTVTNCNDSGAGSLRQAITDANNNAGADTIEFNIPIADAGYMTVGGVSFWQIKPASRFPLIEDTSGGLTIDGSTQATNQGRTYSGTPEILIIGTDAGTGVDGLCLTSNNNHIKNLALCNFKSDTYVSGQIAVLGNSNTVTGCFCGLQPDGTTYYGISAFGIHVNGGQFNVIGGTNANERNICSGNDRSGIAIIHTGSNSNEVIGNYIGTNPAGTGALSNETGISVNLGAAYNIVGGSTVGERNIISGNSGTAVNIDGGSYNNVIRGNYIGTDVTGMVALGNHVGVGVSAAFNTVEGNVISGNSLANLTIASSYNEVKGNYIGLTADGNTALPSFVGIWMVVASPETVQHNIIGGSTAAERNVITGTTGWATIGLSGNYNQIKGNYIGSNASGTAVSGTWGGGSGIGGILIANGYYNVIGGPNIEDRNILAGGYGAVALWPGEQWGIINNRCNSNEVTNNYFGLDPSGTIDLGNSTFCSLYITGEVKYNKIDANTFANNTYDTGPSPGAVLSITIDKAKYNTITRNLFINNHLSAIALGLGSNDNLSAPVIHLINSDGIANTTVTGTAPAFSIIEIFQAVPPSTEALAYLGSVESNASGDWSFIATGLFSSSEITATATDRSGNTSQFSIYSAASTTTTITSTTTSVTTTTTSTTTATTTTTSAGINEVLIDATTAAINLSFKAGGVDGLTTVYIIDPGPPANIITEQPFTASSGVNNISVNLSSVSRRLLPGAYQYKMVNKGRVLASGSFIIR